MRPREVLAAGLLLVASLGARDVAAEAPQKTEVSVAVVGHGSIRLVVSDGATRPCESSNNPILFQGHVRAGDEIKLASSSGSVCVDHTYGAFRESLWAGASVWSGSGAGFSGVRALRGAVSTDEP
jgi:hypothetical protein